MPGMTLLNLRVVGGICFWSDVLIRGGGPRCVRNDSNHRFPELLDLRLPVLCGKGSDDSVWQIRKGQPKCDSGALDSDAHAITKTAEKKKDDESESITWCEQELLRCM